MKKSIVVTLCIIIALLLCVYFIPQKDMSSNELWENAKYTEDATLGQGEKTLHILVSAGDKEITLTVKTDKKTVGEALKEHNLIDGENGEFGLYVKYVNGIRADYDKDKCYWSLNKDGKPTQAGVDFTEFKDGDVFELKVEK